MNTLFVDRLDRAVDPSRLLDAVDGRGPGNQFRRVDHVRRAVAVHDAARVGQFLHQGAGAPRMVEMHVGRDHEAHVLGAAAERRQRIEEARESGELAEGQVVVELTSGNMGTGLAIVCW